MNDMLKEFGDSGAQMAGPSSYAHPQTATVVEECNELLEKIPEGRRLLDYAKDRQIKIDILIGKKIDWKVFYEENRACIFCPANTKAVDLHEMAMALAIAIREMEHKDLGILHPNPALQGAETAHRILVDYFLDINMEMCKIVAEFRNMEEGPKFLDFIKKLRQDEFYEEYVSGKTKEQLRELLFKTLTNVA